jgi:hypothetical protein
MMRVKDMGWGPVAGWLFASACLGVALQSPWAAAAMFWAIWTLLVFITSATDHLEDTIQAKDDEENPSGQPERPWC